MKIKEKIVKKAIKSKESTKERLKPEFKRVTNNERNKIIDNSELSKNNKTDIEVEENEKNYIDDKGKPKINKNFIKKKTVSYKLATENQETQEKEIKDLKPKKISNVQQNNKMIKGPKTETTIKQKKEVEQNSEKNLSRVDLDKRMKLDNENNEESFNENFNKTDDNFRKNEMENDDDNNRKIMTDSLEQSFNQPKESENENKDIYQRENRTSNELKFKNSDAKDESDEDKEKENEEENQKEKENKNEIPNKVNVEQEKINPLGDLKKIFNFGNNQTKLPNKEQNKKGKKAYSNFIQNIKKANKNKKNKVNMLQPEPKPKFVKVVNKIKVFKNISQDKEKEKEKEKEVHIQNENQLEDPLIEHVRNEMLKENEAEQNQRQKENDLNRNEKLEEQENINIEKKEGIKSGYTGFVLLKQTQGANIFQFKFEGSLEEMNKIFKTHKIELEGGPVELIYTKDLEDLRKKAGEKEEKEENEILKEAKNQEPFPNMRKISIEEKIAKKEADDNLKIEEMKERIRIYKEELKKGDDVGIGLERRPRVSIHKKYNDTFEKQSAQQSIPKNNFANNNNANAKANINQQAGNENNKNKVENKKITETSQEKKQYTKIEVEQKKDKDRDKSMSRAMDRFKRRYKKDNSAEVRPKKSEKINEMAKQLEDVLGKGNASAEINYESNISKDIVHENEKEGNLDDVLEKKPVVSKKSKKLQQFQI